MKIILSLYSKAILVTVFLCLCANIASSQIITTIAGVSTGGISGDSVPATLANLGGLGNLTFDNLGNLYVVVGRSVRKINNAGIMNKVAGNGKDKYTGDGGPADSASFYDIGGIAVDAEGDIYISESSASTIRKVNSKTGIITTVVGYDSLFSIFGYVYGKGWYSGDGGPALYATLNVPSGIALDRFGNLYIADRNNNRIRRVDASSGIITTVAGDGIAGFSGDGGPADSAQINFPDDVAVDSAGNIYIADSYNLRIRKVDKNGIITTVAGNGISTFSGDGGFAISAGIHVPFCVKVDALGNIYIPDYIVPRVRRVNTDGIINTVAGNGSIGFTGDGGLATSAELAGPAYLAIDSIGNLYIADQTNGFDDHIRKVTFGIPNPTILSFTPNSTCPGTSIPVFITGANFTKAITAVTVGGAAVDSFTVNDSSSITAYISKGTTGKIVITSPDGIATSDSVFTFGLGHTAYAYVANHTGNNVSVIDVSADTVLTTIGLSGQGPECVTTSRDGTSVYVTSDDGTVSAINTTTNTVSNTVFIGSGSYAEGVDISPDGKTLYVAKYTNPGVVTVINTADMTVKDNITVGVTPYGVCVSPDGSKVVVANLKDATVSIINTQTNKVVATLPVGISPHGVCISPNGEYAYVANWFFNTVTVLNIKNYSVLTTIGVGNNPNGICISQDGQKVYVANFSDGTVSVINTGTNTVSSTISVVSNAGCWGVSLSSDGKKLYVSDQNSYDVAVINTTTNKVTKTISIPGLVTFAIGKFIANVPTLCSTPPPPTITSFKIAACPNTIDTIKGTGFTGATAVTFGGVAAKSFAVINDTTIAATVDSGASGKVTVTTPNGIASLAGFKYLMPTSSTTSQSICQGSSFTFNGKTYTKADTYNVHLTNAAGCDSTAMLVLTVKDTSGSTTNKSICQSSSYTFNGNTYTKADTYTAHLTNSIGCDSTARLVLTVIQPTTFQPIKGNSMVCINDSILLTDATTGGVWSSQNVSIASVDTFSGYVLGRDTGFATISYNDTVGCSKPVTYKVDVVGEPINLHPIPVNANCENAGGGSVSFDDIGGTESPYKVAYLGVKYDLPYTFSNLPVGTYSFAIYNRAGCKVETLPNEIIALAAKDANCDTLYVPTAFVPFSTGSTGYTTVLRPCGGGISIQTLSFKVYNRYGNLVFETHQLDTGWNGMINGVPQDTGTYVWMLNYTPIGGKSKSSKGVSVLIR